MNNSQSAGDILTDHSSYSSLPENINPIPIEKNEETKQSLCST